VDVDEPGADDLPSRLDDLGAVRRDQARPDLLDDTVVDEHVLDGIDLVGRIDDAAAADQDAHMSEGASTAPSEASPRTDCAGEAGARPARYRVFQISPGWLMLPSS
jgi:hypothetical protein